MAGGKPKRIWTKDEEALLTMEWRRSSVKGLAMVFGCSTTAVRSKARKLGLNMEERTETGRLVDTDPVMCEKLYTDDEVEFMLAVDKYKRDSGSKFPTSSEVLAVLKKLGYKK